LWRAQDVKGSGHGDERHLMRTRIKICGFTMPDTALYAALAGADAIGLVFYPPSPRHVGLKVAQAIAQVLPPFVSRVALFVDAPVEQVREVLETVQPDLLQFHGDETPEYCRQFNRPYIKAVRVHVGLNLLQYASQYPDARGLLLDACIPGEVGGTGIHFDWQLIPPALPLPVILSGGLVPDNVAEAIRQVHPWAVDVSSGVESVRGVKDKEKILRFIAEVTKFNSMQGIIDAQR
jgi:phosphoribosylanthranilate isomerase